MFKFGKKKKKQVQKKILEHTILKIVKLIFKIIFFSFKKTDCLLTI